MLRNFARVCGCTWMLAASLALASGACVSPDTFVRDDAGAGAAAQGGGGNGPSGTGGSSTGTAGSNGNGTGGHAPGAGGMTTTGGVGGHTGFGGSIIGPTANFTDDFESTGDVNLRWLAPQSADSTPCGAWSVVADGTTNHVYQQTSTCSNPSWAAGGSVDWVDMRVRARVRFDAATSSNAVISIAVRYNGPKDLYWLEFTNDGGMKMRTRTQTGSSVDIMSLTSKMRVAVPDGQWTTIGLGISGSTLNAYLGDNPAAPPVLTGTASGQVKGGIAVGVAKGTASFDDVVVTPP